MDSLNLALAVVFLLALPLTYLVARWAWKDRAPVKPTSRGAGYRSATAVRCPDCGRRIRLRYDGCYPRHVRLDDPRGRECPRGGTEYVLAKTYYRVLIACALVAVLWILVSILTDGRGLSFSG